MKKSIIVIAMVLFSVFNLWGNEICASGLFSAAVDGNLELVERFLDFGVDIEVLDDRRNIALMWASSYGRGTVVHALLDYGAELEARNSGVLPPLMTASIMGHADSVEILLNRSLVNK